jgi:hypothetical protein
MTKRPPEEPIDRRLKARLREIGLTPTDLAELLDAAFQPPARDGDSPAGLDSGRLAQVATALGLQAGLARSHKGGTTAPLAPEHPAPSQTLLQLRLLRAFCELRDPRARKMPVYLAEQLAKCGGPRPEDAS